MIESVLQSISGLLEQAAWFGPLLALVAGMLTSLLPCSLSTIPLIIGFVGGVGANTKRAVRLSLLFALGAAITFTALGIIASLSGRLLSNAGQWWYIVLGVLMVLMALQTWEIFQIIPATYLQSKNTRRSYIGALSTGILAGVFSSPCATPVLVTLLALVASKGSVLWGAILLLFFSIGHGVLAVVAGTFTGFAQKLTGSESYGKWSKAIRIVMGFLILLLGFYMFYLGF